MTTVGTLLQKAWKGIILKIERKILFIAPLPPPVTGQSLAVKVFKDFIEDDGHNVEVVNLVKDTFNNGIGSFKRIAEVAAILKEVWDKKDQADKIYFTISESIAGNLKDILIYAICNKKLSNMYVHLHGGAGMAVIMGRKNWLTKINTFFLKKTAGIIILGESLAHIYSKAALEKIRVVKNFAEDYLFIEQDILKAKFEKKESINLLFLSNLIPGKGYLEVLKAFESLNDDLKSSFKLKFAGGFETEEQKQFFFKEIDNIPQISYEGIVSGEAKRKLFHEAHVFCLPTYYAYEGQPISILEAYASGCVVITTNHSGIRDIFTPNINGFEVDKKSISSLKKCFENSIAERNHLFQIALDNRMFAEKNYRSDIYNQNLKNAINIE